MSEELKPMLIVSSIEEKIKETNSGKWSRVLLEREYLRELVIIYLIGTIISLIIACFLFLI